MSSSLQQFAHLQIPLEDVASATNSFADDNLIGKDEFGNIYSGQLLLRSGETMNIAARRLDPDSEFGSMEFWTEISMLSRLNHKNIVSIVGFCDENGAKVIVNEHAVHGSLNEYLSGPTLTWIRRLQICLGAARALSYLHFDTGRNFGVIHRDIKSRNILLDENWEAKVCGFGLSMVNATSRRHRLVLSDACGTIGYLDPVYYRTGSVTQKSDVYSLGMVLLEVLCGRKSINEVSDGSQYLDPWARKHYEEGKLEEIVDPELRKQMEAQSFSIFSEIAYHCLNKQRTQRPNMEIVVKRLEKALELQQKHENPGHSRTPAQGISSNRLKGCPNATLKDKSMDERKCSPTYPMCC